MEFKHGVLSEKIIQCFYRVYNQLGYGFLEKVYENALKYEIEKIGKKAESQVPITVFYDGASVGTYFADLVVEDSIILEIKAARSITDEHKAQLLSYLKATGKEVGLVLNFGPEPQIARRVN